MKSVILIACLVVAVSSAPQETQQTEGTKGQPAPQTVPVPAEKKSAKLQSFGPADAQFYTGPVVQDSVVPQQYVGQQQFTYQADQVVPSYYYSGVQAAPGSAPTYHHQQGVLPYNGQSTVSTSAAAPAGTTLPTGHVWEHSGATHFGHLGSAVHVKRTQGSYYYTSPVVSSVAGYPAGSAWTSAAGLVSGTVQYINGQPAQYINGQWYYVNPAQVTPAVYAQGGVAANRPNVPASTVYTSPLYNVKNFQTQPGYVAVQRPAVAPQYVPANKWYTKTNVQPINSPFFGQVPQYAPIPAAGTKSLAAAPRPDVVPVAASEGEKSDW